MSSCFLTKMRNTENKSLSLFPRKTLLITWKKLYAIVLAHSLLSAIVGKANYSHEYDAKAYKRRLYFIFPVICRFSSVHKADNHQICSIQFGEKCQGGAQVMRSGFGTQNILNTTRSGLNKHAFAAWGDGATLTSTVLALVDLLPPTAGDWDIPAAFLPDTWCTPSMGRHWNCLRPTYCWKDTSWPCCFSDYLYSASDVTLPVRGKLSVHCLLYILNAFLLLKEQRKHVFKNKYFLKKKKQENNMRCVFSPHDSISLNSYVLEQVAMAVQVYFIQSLVLLSLLLNYGT